MTGADAVSDPDPRAEAAAARPDAFISYAREDAAVAERLCAGLEGRGKTVWIDRERIEYSASWKQRARAGIDAAKAVVVVLSRAWIASQACQFEFEHARAMNKRLVPVAADVDLEPEGLPAELADLSWIPFEHASTDQLAVDALALTLDTDLAWRESHARLLVRAVEWEQADRDESLLLRGSDLRAAEQWLDRRQEHEETPTTLHTDYVLAGRRAASRRQRVVLGFVGIALLVSVALGVVAYWQRGVAVDREREAVAQRRLAERNAAESRRQAAVATSRQLAALATGSLETDIDRGMLLSLEAFRIAPTVEARESMLAAVQRSPRLQAVLHGAGASALRDTAFSEDGRVLATVDDGGGMRLWDVEQRRLRQSQELRKPLKAVAISHDGRSFAAGGEGAIWTGRTDRAVPLQRLSVPGTVVLEVAYGAGGRTLAAVTSDGVLRRWDVPRGRPLPPRSISRNTVVAASTSRDGSRAVILDLDGVSAWDLAKAKRLGVAAFAGSASPTAVAISPDARRVAIALTGGTVTVRDGAGLRSRESLPTQIGTVVALAFSGDGALLAIGGGNGDIELWDVRRRRRVGPPLESHTQAVQALAFSPSGRELVSVSDDRTTRRWDVARRVPLATSIDTRNEAATTLAFARGSRWLVSGGRKGRIVFWDKRARQEPARALVGHRAPVLDIAASSSLLAAGEADGNIGLWSLGRPGAKPKWLRHDGRVLAVAFTPNGRVLASGGTDGTVKLWDTARRQLLRTVPAGNLAAPDIAVGPDGRWLAVAGIDGAIRLCEVARCRALESRLHGPRLDATSLAFNPRGDLLAAGSADKRVWLWRIPSRRGHGSALSGHKDSVQAVAFVAGGRLLISAGADGDLLLWDVRSRRLIGPVHSGAHTIRALATAPAGTTVASAQSDGSVAIWDGFLFSDRFAVWRRHICGIIGRSLSPEEWTAVLPDLPRRQTCAGSSG